MKDLKREEEVADGMDDVLSGIFSCLVLLLLRDVDPTTRLPRDALRKHIRIDRHLFHLIGFQPSLIEGQSNPPERPVTLHHMRT